MHCGHPLIKDGELKCSRSGNTVLATPGKKRIFCPKCWNPRVTLAKDNQAVCPKCDQLTPIVAIKEKAEMPKTAAKAESGPTKLTTKEYNDLLQQWLKDEKKKRKELAEYAYRSDSISASSDAAHKEVFETDQRIEVLEKAIALNFDPDKFEKFMNVPLHLHDFDPNNHSLCFRAEIRGRVLSEIFINPIYKQSLTITQRNFSLFSDATRIHVEDVEKIDYFAGLPGISSVCFDKGTRSIKVYVDGKINDIDSSP